ncbi:hypothetical protein E4U41_001905 [Claviceps citrina]|nr:hypothetical protein E4U41_001905 [Claviceps citrina]UGT01577.1 IdtB [Claviceps citrina]
MDGFSSSHQPPSAYKQVQWLDDSFVALLGLGWVINYVLMIRGTIKGEPRSMAFVALCCNIGWELTYTLVYPPAHRLELLFYVIGVSLNVFIMMGAARSARIEWRRSPLLAAHAGHVLLAGTMACFSGHVVLAMEIGRLMAFVWGAGICQVVLSAGGLCLLLQRNSTEGTSWLLWSSRFLGSCSAIGCASVRYKYWPEAYGWLASPITYWILVMFFLLDGTYGVCLYLVSRAEAKTGKRD